MFMLTAPIFKNSNIKARIYFIFLKITSSTKLENVLIPNLISVKRLEKQLPYKANFTNLLQRN